MKKLTFAGKGRHAVKSGRQGAAAVAAACLLLVLCAIYFSVRAFNNSAAENRAQISAASVPEEGGGAADAAAQSRTPESSAQSSGAPSSQAQSQSEPAPPAQSTQQSDTAPPPAGSQPEQTEEAVQTQAFIAPLAGDVDKAYSDGQLVFSPTLNDWRVHTGLDIAAPVGTTVESIADGQVESVYYDELCGQTVSVAHAGGYVSVYCGLGETVFVNEGETVTQGTPLGTVGEQMPLEMAQGPHLHLEIIRDGVRIDPLSLIG